MRELIYTFTEEERGRARDLVHTALIHLEETVPLSRGFFAINEEDIPVDTLSYDAQHWCVFGHLEWALHKQLDKEDNRETLSRQGSFWKTLNHYISVFSREIFGTWNASHINDWGFIPPSEYFDPPTWTSDEDRYEKIHYLLEQLQEHLKKGKDPRFYESPTQQYFQPVPPSTDNHSSKESTGETYSS